MSTLQTPSSSTKIIAFHLPQFHRIPENDRWWGDGFTDWTNVRHARPLYDGHQQPRVPLGGRYYDLTDAATREWQANLAREYRVDGFCYYHYWFNGKKLLEQPAEAILASGSPDFPFCFSWANEAWTRSWDGATRDVLIQQDYGGEPEWRTHFDYLLPFFKDRRYLAYQGKPMFLVYRPQDFPTISRMFAAWQRWAQDADMPGISFIKTLTCFDDTLGGPEYAASVAFEPWLAIRRRTSFTLRARWLAERAVRAVLRSFDACRCHQWPYEAIWENMVSRKYAANEFRGAFVGWDNTPRRGEHARIVSGATPQAFGRFMRRQLAAAVSDGSPFVFVNAWNEWAEGAFLEPDEADGHAYLEQLRDAVEAVRGQGIPAD
jgi:lipopolysaccharide biosynthesis protein